MIVRVVYGKFEREAKTAEYPERELSSGGSGESTGDRGSAELLSGTPQ
jgi:hypothetical protein